MAVVGNNPSTPDIDYTRSLQDAVYAFTITMSEAANGAASIWWYGSTVAGSTISAAIYEAGTEPNQIVSETSVYSPGALTDQWHEIPLDTTVLSNATDYRLCLRDATNDTRLAYNNGGGIINGERDDYTGSAYIWDTSWNDPAGASFPSAIDSREWTIYLEYTPDAAGVQNDRSLSDGLPMTDSPQGFRTLFRQVLQNMALTDSLTVEVTLPAVIRTLTSTLLLSDSVGIARERAIVIASNLDVSELLQNQRFYFRQGSDAIEMFDELIALLQGRIIEALLDDGLNVTDVQQVTREFTKQVVANVIISDAIAKESAVFRLLADNADISDEVLASLIRQLNIINLTDNIDISDELIKTLTQLLVTWGIIKTDLKLEPILTDIEALNIKTDIEALNIKTGIEQ